MAPKTREEVFKFRLTEEERRMLEAIAEHTGLSASDVARQGIRKLYAELPPKARAKIK